jgi:hypothetical protein
MLERQLKPTAQFEPGKTSSVGPLLLPGRFQIITWLIFFIRSLDITTKRKSFLLCMHFLDVIRPSSMNENEK